MAPARCDTVRPCRGNCKVRGRRANLGWPLTCSLFAPSPFGEGTAHGCPLRSPAIPRIPPSLGLEVLNHTIIGCAGPFQDEGAVQEEFDPAAPFERSAELLRWLGRRNLERIAALRATRRWGRHPLQE